VMVAMLLEGPRIESASLRRLLEGWMETNAGAGITTILDLSDSDSDSNTTEGGGSGAKRPRKAI
jgi:hypothetical protein